MVKLHGQKKFCKRNPRYKVISWDLEFMRRFKGRRYAEISSDEQLLAMGEAIEDGSDQNLVIDGNYLNLPLRTAIINTLHEYGYNIYLADLTPQFEETLAFRIADEVDRYQRMPKYANCSYEDIKRRVTKAIYSFKQDEENRSAFSEQVRCGVVDLGVEKVIGPKDLEMTEVKRNFRK